MLYCKSKFLCHIFYFSETNSIMFHNLCILYESSLFNETLIETSANKVPKLMSKKDLPAKKTYFAVIKFSP